MTCRGHFYLLVSMVTILAVGLGGALGALCRYGVGLTIIFFYGSGFHPWATLLVNVLGSGLMGVCYALLGLGGMLSDSMRGLVMIGFLGGLTTFSSFSLDVVDLIEHANIMIAVLYALSSVILSLLAFALMVWMIRVW